MEESLIIAVARHGKSQTNEATKLALEIPNWLIGLVDKGEEQAKEAGEVIKNKFPNKKWLIFSSNFERGVETARIIKDNLGGNALGIATTNSIQEFHSGSEATNDKIYDGHISRLYGNKTDYESRQNNPFYFQSFPFKDLEESPADGETGASVIARTKVMKEALIRFAITKDISSLNEVWTNAKNSGSHEIETDNLGIILTSHSLAISALLHNFGLADFGSMASRYRCGNADPFFIEISKDGIVKLMEDLNRNIKQSKRKMP